MVSIPQIPVFWKKCNGWILVRPRRTRSREASGHAHSAEPAGGLQKGLLFQKRTAGMYGTDLCPQGYQAPRQDGRRCQLVSGFGTRSSGPPSHGLLGDRAERPLQDRASTHAIGVGESQDSQNLQQQQFEPNTRAATTGTSLFGNAGAESPNPRSRMCMHVAYVWFPSPKRWGEEPRPLVAAPPSAQ